MNETHSSESHSAPEQRTSALFANMVAQQTNMALMFLGRVPHPESGQPIRDLNTARMFIDQLEMLEAKTKGNLDKSEQSLLKQSLTGLRMAFVEAANEEGPPANTETSPAGPADSSAKSRPASADPVEPADLSPDAESRKKFSKKY